jgi:hypothetical protein
VSKEADRALEIFSWANKLTRLASAAHHELTGGDMLTPPPPDKGLILLAEAEQMIRELTIGKPDPVEASESSTKEHETLLGQWRQDPALNRHILKHNNRVFVWWSDGSVRVAYRVWWVSDEWYQRIGVALTLEEATQIVLEHSKAAENG